MMVEHFTIQLTTMIMMMVTKAMETMMETFLI
jgi:hypothetical protein